MNKTYVLDTSVLLSSPYSIYAFDEHTVVLLDVTLEYIEKAKTRNNENSSNAKILECELEKLCMTGDAKNGYALPGGGKLLISTTATSSAIPDHWDKSMPGNQVLAKCTGLMRKNADTESLILVTNDINTRLKAKILGIKAEPYRSDRGNEDRYKGRIECQVDQDVINEFYEYGGISGDVCYDEEGSPVRLFENEFVLLKAPYGNKSAIGVYRNGTIERLKYTENNVFGVKAKNVGQKFALEALMRPQEIAPLVILKGPAGTSKTFLSLAAGLQQVKNDHLYARMLISRPNIKFDEDIGYLKGGETEKIEPLIRPVKDNLQQLLKKNKGDNSSFTDIYGGEMEKMLETGVIDAQAMAYMRGRSIADTWIIIDEAQNMTPMQAFGIISRAGAGSKIILAGDPEQIDNPHLDKLTNGLTFASEKMKGSPLCWQVEFNKEECVRSPLAVDAVQRLAPKGHTNFT